MFGKQKDILGAEERSFVSNDPARDLNHEVELKVKANSMASVMFPKPGDLSLGDVGIEFRSDAGIGYVHIPWQNITRVVVDMPAKNYVHAITVETDETAPLQFVISEGSEVVRCIARHIGRDKLAQGPQNFKAIGRSIKDKVTGAFKKKDKGDN